MPSRSRVECEDCGHVMQIGEFPFCPHGSTHSRSLFKPYDVQIGSKTYTIDSLQSAMKIEKQYAAEHRATGRNSEIAFHAFHFNNSNRDVNAFGDPAKPKWQPRENVQCEWGLPPGVKGE